MLTKIGRWIALVFAVLLCIVVVAAAAVYGISAVRLNRTYASVGIVPAVAETDP